ncbi:DUF2202 domain-containing protein [Dactylosporangium aurantiacum]|uniref:DUF2202 domain-containing protein n=1 Tax=Dactylosporangium aurantiacum TaxID=35754 RepID=A0A9Q9ICT8_9ACTN|nr:DUF2202 domain-containing protein [Dactylosporangium aurantiacum]MDG6110426.1 DUF2202 domain-containing protein [Dactylosporangium aurantiacum]UWZ51049.1 DUF2202 domain-containing protein [Dactylosporangium aurantiacum]
MKTTTRRAVTLVAAGALGLGGLAAAAPALAGAGPVSAAAGWHGGYGMGAGGGHNVMGDGNGMMGGGMMGGGNGGMTRDGGCVGLAITADKGTLTEGQQRTLAAMAQEEQLAHDLYIAFAAKYDAVVFDHIAAAETRHLSVVRTLLQRYGLADPTAGKPAGQFSDSTVQATYDKLLAQGQADQAAALEAGRQVERTDIADLRAALGGLTAPDVRQSYTHLLAASQHHLTAFDRWSTR